MRLSVRPSARINDFLGFSRAVKSAPDTTISVVLYRTLNPISSQSDSRVPVRQEEKRTLPGAPANVSKFACVAANGQRPIRIPVWEY